MPLRNPLWAEIYLQTIDGRLEVALDAGARLTTLSEELGSALGGRQNATMATIRPLLYLGRGEEALVNLTLVGQMAGAAEGLTIAIERAVILAHLGRRGEAQDALHQLLARWNIGLDEEETSVGNLAPLLETAVLVQERDAASVLAQRLSSVASLALADTRMICIARQLGAAAALLGAREQAKGYYQQALEVCAKVRFRPEIALTRLQLAELLLEEAAEMEGAAALKGGPSASDLHKEAMEHLDFAIGEFQAMKMKSYLERALRHKGLLKA